MKKKKLKVKFTDFQHKMNKAVYEKKVKVVKRISDIMKMNNNGRITKSKILKNRRLGDSKLGFYSDSGYRTNDYNIDS